MRYEYSSSHRGIGNGLKLGSWSIFSKFFTALCTMPDTYWNLNRFQLNEKEERMMRERVQRRREKERNRNRRRIIKVKRTEERKVHIYTILLNKTYNFLSVLLGHDF